jgi:hypothetical protein
VTAVDAPEVGSAGDGPLHGLDKYAVVVLPRPGGGFDWKVYEWRQGLWDDQKDWGYRVAFDDRHRPAEGRTRTFRKATNAAIERMCWFLHRDIRLEMEGAYRESGAVTFANGEVVS